ncbi:MAG: FecR domain-containing protein [Prolixibacteraceae bacterium]|jgi:transmembrane sensor|nr:FecR domain-containing protein [Prolixibacteraceae bacterium]
MDQKLIENIEAFAGGYNVQARRSHNDVWKMLNHRIEEAENHRTRKFSRRSLLVGSIAAVFVFGFILYTGMFNTGKYSPKIKTEIASVKKYYLPDSSIVFLNSNSTIKYHYNNFTGERSIVLKGEAIFDVSDGRKFTVDFNGGKVKVLGTSFSISAYSDDYLQFDCLDGKVELNLDIQRKKIRLSKGEGLYVCYEEISQLHDVNADSVYERLNGIYHWEKIRLDNLLSFIGNRFGYVVDLKKIDNNRRFSGKVDLTDLNAGLDVVAFAMGIDYSVSDNDKTITFNANSK